jgi:hypothetical protein
MNKPTYQIFGKIIFWLTTLTVITSGLIFLYVLNFQTKSISASELDFQGAGAAAGIIPSFSGILLAAWAIYFQIKSNTPSYKTAEKILIDIINFRNSNLGMIYALKNSSDKMVIFDEDDFTDYTEEQEKQIEEYLDHSLKDNNNDWIENADKKEYDKKIIAAENNFFKTIAKNINTSESNAESNSFGSLAIRTLPIIKFLSFNLNNDMEFDFAQFENKLNIQSEKYNHLNAEISEVKHWLISTLDILLKIESIIDLMMKNKMISVEKIEYFIINKNASEIIQKIENERIERDKIKNIILSYKKTKKSFSFLRK